MPDSALVTFGIAFACAWLALSMELLGITHPRAPRWIMPLSAILAAPTAYLMAASATRWPLPDPENWTALGTIVIAITAVVGVGFGLSTLRELQNQGAQTVRQTHAMVEQAWPHLEVVTDEIPLLKKHQDNRWWGDVRHVFGTTPARDIDVWLREPDGHYFWTFNLILPATEQKFALPKAADGLAAQNPFRVMDDEPLPGQGWVGVVWRCPDGAFRYDLIAFTFNDELELKVAYRNRRDPGFRRPLSGQAERA